MSETTSVQPTESAEQSAPTVEPWAFTVSWEEALVNEADRNDGGDVRVVLGRRAAQRALSGGGWYAPEGTVVPSRDTPHSYSK